MRITKDARWALVSAVLLALLGWIAVLQYRSIASITETERTHLREAALSRARQVAEAFDRELAAAYTPFYGLTLQQVGDPAAAAWRALERWRATAKHPRLIRDVLLFRQGSSGPELRRVTAGGGSEPIEWPPEFKASIVLLKGSGTIVPGSIRGFLLADIPAFFVPMMNVQTPSPDAMQPALGARGSFSIAGLLFGWLDRDGLEKELLTALIAKHIGPPGTGEYLVAVVRKKDPKQFIYLSDAGIDRKLFATPDVQVSLCNVRLEQVMQAMAGSAAVGFRSDPDAGEWQLRLVHRAGSIDRAVTIVKRRNLAISFSTILLVAASLAFLVVSTRRSQRLAQQQVVFVAGVSHELRTPLAIIRSAGENLSDGVIAEPDQVKRYGRLIAEEGRRLSDMVEQVMSFAGFHAGRELTERTTVAAADLIDEAARRSRLETQGITLVRSIGAAVPLLRVNVPAMIQVLDNVLVNAAKYGGPDRWVGIAVEVASEAAELRIHVSDHGSGIRPDELRRIFEPFYRGRDVVASTVRGSGLGLSLARRIVEAHGGTITVKSARGQGSTFTVRLPLASCTDSTASRGEAPAAEGAADQTDAQA